MSHHHHGNSVIINTNSGREGREVPIKCARSAKRKGGKTRRRREEEEVLPSPLPPPHNAHLTPLDWRRRRRRRPPPEGEAEICEVATGGKELLFIYFSIFQKRDTPWRKITEAPDRNVSTTAKAPLGGDPLHGPLCEISSTCPAVAEAAEAYPPLFLSRALC